MTNKAFRQILTAAALAASFAGSAALAAAAAADAQKVFVAEHKCVTCHSVAAVGLEATTKSDKMKGPDLSGYKLAEGKTFAEVAAYARKEAELDGKSHKKGFKGTDEELQTILDWLGSLEASSPES